MATIMHMWLTLPQIFKNLLSLNILYMYICAEYMYMNLYIHIWTYVNIFAYYSIYNCRYVLRIVVSIFANKKTQSITLIDEHPLLGKLAECASLWKWQHLQILMMKYHRWRTHYVLETLCMAVIYIYTCIYTYIYIYVYIWLYTTIPHVFIIYKYTYTNETIRRICCLKQPLSPDQLWSYIWIMKKTELVNMKHDMNMRRSIQAHKGHCRPSKTKIRWRTLWNISWVLSTRNH